MKTFTAKKMNLNKVIGTSLKGYVDAPYSFLFFKFGNGDHMDYSGDKKISTMWLFQCDETAEYVTLYEYKETKLYDFSYPSIYQFRSMPSYEWHVGAKNKETADDFISWLTRLMKEDGIN